MNKENEFKMVTAPLIEFMQKYGEDIAIVTETGATLNRCEMTIGIIDDVDLLSREDYEE